MQTKQVIVIRKDLNMRKGKIAAQAAHASMAVILNQTDNQVKTDLSGNRVIVVNLKKELEQWIIDDPFTKVVVYVKSEEELKAIYDKAKEKNVLCSYIVDSGRTEFNGVPTPTCAAIGPGFIDEIDEITNHLPLL